MDGISIAIAAFISGCIVGGWMIRNEERRKASAMQNAEWARENAELAEINRTRLNFGREPLTSETWRRLRHEATEKATKMAWDFAMYDPARDGERWKTGASIWQRLSVGGENPPQQTTT